MIIRQFYSTDKTDLILYRTYIKLILHRKPINIYIKKENYQKRVKDFISTTFLIP